MRKRPGLPLVLTLLCGWIVAASPTLAQPPRRPNILLVTADDLGLQLGSYGDKVATTPNLDKLAQSSVRFTNAFVTQSSCSSSRSSLLTGLYPHQNGQIGLAHLGYQMNSPTIPNLPALLKQAGYRTGLIGKLHVEPAAAFPFDFKQPSAPESRNAELVQKRINAFLDGNTDDQPFFLYLNFFDPHGPYLPDVNGRPAHKVRPADVSPWPFITRGKPAPPQAIANFYSCINRVDELFGLTLDTLRKHGAADNLLIIFVGDNGPPFADAKTTCTEAGLKVPCLIQWPGHDKPGTTCDSLVSLADIMPPLLDAASIPAPSGLAGRSLAGPLRGDPSGWRTTIAGEYTTHEPNHFNPLRSIRDNRYKLILGLLHDPHAGLPTDLDGKPLAQAFLRFGANQAVELYDLQTDPYEKTNLADRPEVQPDLKRLQAALLEWRRATADPLLDPSELARLTREQYERSKTYVPAGPPDPAASRAASEGKPRRATPKAAAPRSQ
jgi:N-sulfoglucosamine sulfohydrolase